MKLAAVNIIHDNHLIKTYVQKRISSQMGRLGLEIDIPIDVHKYYINTGERF